MGLTVGKIAKVRKRMEVRAGGVLSFHLGFDTGGPTSARIGHTSAGCVVVCWTPEAIKSVCVKAEAKKGLDRDVLVPIFLETCTLPVPFNGIDTANLSNWNGEEDSPDLKRVLSTVKRKADESKADTKHRMAKSRAGYERIDDKIYPGTLTLLARRIAAIRERDPEEYQSDIEAVLAWVESIAEKEAKHTAYG
jgi:hypothetical protein